jgi:hypothetical protein
MGTIHQGYATVSGGKLIDADIVAAQAEAVRRG